MKSVDSNLSQSSAATGARLLQGGMVGLFSFNYISNLSRVLLAFFSMRSLSSSLSFCHHLHSSPPVPALPLLLSSRAVPVGRSQPGRAWLFLLNGVSSSFFLSSGPAVSEPASLFLLHPICLHVLGGYSLLVSERTSRQHALHPHCAHPQTCKRAHTHIPNMHMHSVAYVMSYRVCYLGEGRFWQCTCITVVRDGESNLPPTTHVPSSTWKHSHACNVPVSRTAQMYS